MRIEMEQPYWFVLIPIILGYMFFTWRNWKTKNKTKKVQMFGIRCFIMICLVLALVGIHISRRSKTTATIFVIDMSDSVSTQIEQEKKLMIEAVSEAEKGEKIGIVTFGADSKVEQFVTESKNLSLLETTPVTTATNLEQAIQKAITLYPEGVAKRMVIISDGQENEGTVEKMSPSIKQNQISVAYKKLEQNTGEEVYLSNVKVPENISIGAKFKVTVEVKSTVQTAARIQLYQGETLKGTKEVQVETGTNTFVFQDQQESEGLKEYRVVIEPQRDTLSINNQYVGFTNAKESDKVLVIEGTNGQSNELVKILKEANYQFRVCSAKNAPKKITDLLQYKSIILVDVYATDLPTGFMNCVESYVKDYAGGFVAVGGENSFALGEYKNTVLEKILPVNMTVKGKEQNEDSAILLVIDQSGSMGEVTNGQVLLNLAKEAAIKAVETVEEYDSIGVIVFSDKYSWVVPLQKATKKEAIIDKINTIQVTGGTSIYPAVYAGYEAMKEYSAKTKHIILLTDGQDEFNQYGDLLTKLQADKITLSSVACGEEVDEVLLHKLADGGKGRYYSADGNTDIPRIFAREVLMATDTYIKNEVFTPTIKSNSAIVRQFASTGFPELKGYIASSIKETATMHLASNEEKPILSSLQYGLGKTVAFNSDVENKWTANYAKWDGYVSFWKNIIDYTISRDTSGKDEVVVNQTLNGANVLYKAESCSEDTTVAGSYMTESGETIEVEMEMTGPGVFESDVELKEVGVYSFCFKRSENGVSTASINRTIAKQYSKEYMLDSIESTFDHFIKQVGATSINHATEIWTVPVVNVQESVNSEKFFVIIAMIFFFLDIANRRIQQSIINKIIPKKWITFFKKTKKTVQVAKQKLSIRKNERTKKKEELEENDFAKIDRKKEEPKKRKKEKQTNQVDYIDMNQLLKKKKQRNQ